MKSLRVLKESKSTKPLGVVLRDGSVAGPGRIVPVDALLGGEDAYNALLEENPLRVKKVTERQQKKEGAKK